ncbi:MAG: hypothetical protein MJ252_18755 [archaeon]|nr:hypothetical protein [archaeon]
MEQIDINQLSGTQYLLLKNLSPMLSLVLEQISDFTQTNPMKVKSLSTLSYLISQCGKYIQSDTYTRGSGIFHNLFKYLDNDPEIVAQCEKCSIELGKKTDQNILIPLIIKSINELEANTTLQPLYVRIKFISHYLQEIPNISIENATLIVETLNKLDIFNMADSSYSTNMLICLFNIYSSLINSLKENCSKIHELIFFPLLLLSSLPETVKIRNEVIKVMQSLSSFCGFMKIEDLYSLEMGSVLEKFKTSYKEWKRNSPDRFAFDIYVKLAGTALEKHWTEVLLIMSQCCDSEKDIEMRMDMVLLLDKIISNDDLHEQLLNYTDFILPEILFPSVAWRVGRPNYKVRKAAMVDLIHIFTKNLIDPEIALKYFSDFLSTLKNTLEDDYDAELRYIALQLLKQYLIKISLDMKYDHLAELYNPILKRLDDSQDANRILTCELLIIFLESCKRLHVSESIYDFMVGNSFIHLDDPNEKVREAVKGYLIKAAEIHTKEFLGICEKNENSFTHKSILNEVKNVAENILKSG